MNRRMIYTGALPEDLDINQNMQFAMIALGFLAESVMGQPTWAYGFTPAATTPASLTMNFGRGAMGSMTVVDQTNPGSSAIADTTDPLMKIGLNLASTPITFTPPATSGQSQVFLVQAQMQESDTGPTVLPYYNAANPAQPYSGPNNTGASNNTIRAQTVALEVVAGAPAATGSQTAPSPTAGWSPLYLLTLANGQTTITAGNVTVAPGAPFLPFTLPALSPGFSRMQVLTASTTWTAPLGVTRLRATVIGGGGPGGSTAACSGSQISTAPGGNAGCIGIGIYAVTSGQNIPVTVGAAGVASLSGGSNGGTSSLGALCTAPGGQAASNVPANPPPLTQGSTLATRQASGGMINGFEAQGLPSISGTLENVFSGKGADCGDFGTGGSGQGLATIVGVAGHGFGAGGGGAVTASGGSAQIGGNGAPGVVILEY